MMITVIVAATFVGALILILFLLHTGLATIAFIAYLMAAGGYIASSVHAHRMVIAVTVALPLLVLPAFAVFHDRDNIRELCKER